MTDEEDEDTTATRIINQITLDCLLNKEQYSKYLNSNMNKTLHSNKKDRKFYKKRILQLTKDLLSSETDATMDIMYAFDNFTRTCISYFKMMDKTDILQTDYSDFIVPDMGTINPEDTTLTFEDTSMSFMRTVKVDNITMDKFVKRTSTAPPKTQIVPLQREVNLKDPELRNKGIRKKKNVETVYEESTKEEETTNTKEEVATTNSEGRIISNTDSERRIVSLPEV